MIKYDPTLRKLFEDIDQRKARVWALTNAFRPVGRLLLYPPLQFIQFC